MGNRQKSNRFQSNNDVKFIDLALTAAQDKQLKASEFKSTLWPKVLDELIAQGLKVTFKEDARNKTIMLLVQAAVPDPDEITTIWVLRSGSASGALYKFAWYWSISDGTLPEDDRDPMEGLSDDDLFA